MIPKFNQRIWIIFCWYIAFKCLVNDLNLVPTVQAQNYQQPDDTNSKNENFFFGNEESQNEKTYSSNVINNKNNNKNNNKINLVSYAASIDNILDINDNEENIIGKNNVDNIEIFEQNHNENVKNDANDEQHKRHHVLVNRIIQKYYPKAKRSKRSALSYVDDSESSFHIKAPESYENATVNTFLAISSPSSSSSSLSSSSFSTSTSDRSATSKSSTSSTSSRSSLNSEVNENNKNGKMAVKNIINNNNNNNKNNSNNNKNNIKDNNFNITTTSSSSPQQTTSIPSTTTPKFAEQIVFLNPNVEKYAEPRRIVKERDVKMAGELRNANAFLSDEPIALPLRPIIRGPYEEEQDEFSVVYAEQRLPVKLHCEVDLDVTTSVWMKDGQVVHAADLKSPRTNDIRFVKEDRGGLSITNVMLEDNGIWQCEAENFRGYVENARPVKLIVLDPPKEPYLLIDGRRLDAGNMFIPVKENSELTLACVSEGGNPKPILTWEVLLSPGIDRHAQKIMNDVLELQEIKKDKDQETNKMNSGAISEAKLPAVYRAHHNARILCVMEHPTLKMRQNASILLDVQYTPSFAITRTPGFGYPLREGIEVSLKCDVDSNPSSTPVWQKDDGEPPVPQSGDGYLNFTSIRREHSGWYKCTSRHLNLQYSSIGYYLSVRYDSVDVTSEPVEQELSMSSSSSNGASGLGLHSYKGQMEVELGGSVTLQCPQGSLGCWSHLDPVSARLKGLGMGMSTPTGQFSLKDVVYQDAGTYKCVGQNPNNRKKLEVLQTVSIAVKGAPTVNARNTTPIAYPGSPLHLSVEFCANPPAYAARWLHGDRIYTPGNQYGIDVLAYGFIDLPTPYCKEARLTYVHMHDRVPRIFYFIVSSPGGVAEAVFNVNFTLKHKTTGSLNNKFNNNINSNSNNLPNSIDEDEELMEPEEIQFPIFGSSSGLYMNHNNNRCYLILLLALLTCFICFIN